LLHSGLLDSTGRHCTPNRLSWMSAALDGAFGRFTAILNGEQRTHTTAPVDLRTSRAVLLLRAGVGAKDHSGCARTRDETNTFSNTRQHGSGALYERGTRQQHLLLFFSRAYLRAFMACAPVFTRTPYTFHLTPPPPPPLTVPADDNLPFHSFPSPSHTIGLGRMSIAFYRAHGKPPGRTCLLAFYALCPQKPV